jgi:hypothetical protein
MAQKISLKQAERKVFRTAFQDGLWDIFIGCIVLQFAIAPILSVSLGDFWSSAVFLPFWALTFVVILFLKKRVVTPRIGLVKFGSFRKVKLIRFTSIMLVVNTVAFVIGLFFSFRLNIESGRVLLIMFGLIVLILSSISAYFLNFTRLLVYGLLFLLSLMVGEWLFSQFKVAHHGFPITFGITAAIIISTGLVLFFRFLSTYSIPASGKTSKETAE